MSYQLIAMAKIPTETAQTDGMAHMAIWSVKAQRTGALQATLFMYQDINGWKSRFKL